jgi:cytochrome c-type biogenesis protein CcmH
MLLRALRAGAEDRTTANRAQTNARVLGAVAADLERERASGLLAPADYAQARAELERRVLAEIGAGAGPPSPHAARATAREAEAMPLRRGVIVAAGVALPFAAALLYAAVGTPAAVRFASSDAAAGVPAAASQTDQRARLQAHLRGQPDDARAWVLLARLSMDGSEFDAAADAYRRALAASPKVARDPLVWCEYADALGMAQSGTLAGPPRVAIERALSLDPEHPRALEMAGSAAYEAREYRAAASYWARLLARIPADTPAHAQLAAAVARAEQRARFELPRS